MECHDNVDQVLNMAERYMQLEPVMKGIGTLRRRLRGMRKSQSNKAKRK